MKWTRRPEIMKPLALKPMGWEPKRNDRFGLYIAKSILCLLIVLSLMMLSGCSKAVSITPMPAPPANLASDCPQLPNPPSPLIDPDRAIWEVNILTAYADCAAKHRLSIEAWHRAVNSAE